MKRPECHAVVISRSGAWARVRVRGLLRNTALARRLESVVGADCARIQIETATVRIRAGDPAQVQGWLRRLSAEVDAHFVGSAADAAAAITARQRPMRTGPTPWGDDRLAGKAPASQDANDPNHHVPALDLLLKQVGRNGSGGAEIDGLDAEAASRRLRTDGPNEIRDITGRTAAEILGSQFKSVPVALLGVSAAAAMATRAFADAGAIGAVLATNAGIGFMTERRAEQTVSSLRKLGPRQATVLRDGAEITLDARDVVAGDVLVLKPGEPVAADARVISSHRLAANEAALTGESLPVRKEPLDGLPAATPVGERRNMVFMGTVISGGAGRALVVATGERAMLGRIRRLAQAAEAPHTQLQQELDRLGRRLAVGAAALCAGVFVLGAARGRPLGPLLRTAVSLGVAAIPEGLPTVATSLLAHGIRSLQERNIYARSLDAIENLGAVDTVCFDKTGTLTENRMSIASVSVGASLVALDTLSPAPTLPTAWGTVAVLCNSLEEVDGQWQGSSTELALFNFIQGQGVDVAGLRQRHPVLAVRHRSEHHPYMVTVHESAGQGALIAVKGRPDQVLARCDQWHDGGALRPLTPARRRHLLALNDDMAARGERVMALAYREHDERDYGETAGLTWLGLVGLADPLRPGLPAMMDRLRAAGIRPLMITGDQRGTAEAVARRIGLDGERPIVDAATLPESADQMAAVAEQSSGFARTSPAMKLELVRGLQQHGHVVAMTGDGINDGPALKAADVGVAMGVTGTDFAHAMSDLVLRDDHPQAMLQAVEQGRTAFLNIRKSVRYLVATNLSELASTTLAVGVGLPEPLDPLALLWTNIATDIWPAIALGLEPAEPGVLERPPVSLREGLLDRGEWGAVATDAGTMTLACLAAYGWGIARYGPGPQARTLAFMSLTSSQLLYALAARSARPLRHGGLRPNPTLRHAVGWSLVAQAGTVMLPAARRLLRTTPLGVADALVVTALAVLPLLTREVLKERRAGQPKGQPS